MPSVAEVNASAFVERAKQWYLNLTTTGVAEVNASAFVERSNADVYSANQSSGVAEVNASAFVERNPRGSE